MRSSLKLVCLQVGVTGDGFVLKASREIFEVIEIISKAENYFINALLEKKLSDHWRTEF